MDSSDQNGVGHHEGRLVLIVRFLYKNNILGHWLLLYIYHVISHPNAELDHKDQQEETEVELGAEPVEGILKAFLIDKVQYPRCFIDISIDNLLYQSH